MVDVTNVPSCSCILELSHFVLDAVVMYYGAAHVGRNCLDNPLWIAFKTSDTRG